MFRLNNNLIKMKSVIVLLASLFLIHGYYINVQRSSLAVLTKRVKQELPIILNLYRVFFISDETEGFLIIIQGKYTDVNEFNKYQYRNLFNNMFQNLRVTTFFLINSKFSQYYLIMLHP